MVERRLFPNDVFQDCVLNDDLSLRNLVARLLKVTSRNSINSPNDINAETVEVLLQAVRVFILYRVSHLY